MEKIYRTTVNGTFELTGKELQEFLHYQDVAAAEQKAIFAATAREKRNYLLLTSDWIELPSCSLSNTKKQEFALYRQALRDVPQQAGFPENIIWPTKPV